MSETTLSISGESFLINGKLTYSEIPGSSPDVHGLLMNSRFIQGIFDDKADPSRFARWGRDSWDPEQHTDDLIAALPEWYRYGLRAFTVGFQGGGPCFTINNLTLNNNPFSEDGTTIDAAYLARMDRLIRAADEIGMVAIVSYFYGDQTRFLRDGKAVRNAVTTASNWLRDSGFTNVIVEVANEYDINQFTRHPILYYPEGTAALCDLARAESGGMPVGCSGGGGSHNREVAEASDVVLIHGNGTNRQRLYNMITNVRGWGLNRPIVTNEDSQAIGQMEVTYKTRTSWGYYNNMTMQEPPADWTVKPGEDQFFAYRMAKGLGIDVDDIPAEDQFVLMGLEPNMAYEGQRYVRLASLYPENINFVEFFRNSELYYVSYDEPFPVHYLSNWRQGGVESNVGDVWKAVIHMRDGSTLEREETVTD